MINDSKESNFTDLNTEFAQFNADIKNILKGNFKKDITYQYNQNYNQRRPSSKISIDADKNQSKGYYDEYPLINQQKYSNLEDNSDKMSITSNFSKSSKKTQEMTQIESKKKIEQTNKNFIKEQLKDYLRKQKEDETKLKTMFQKKNTEFAKKCFVKKKECEKMSEMLDRNNEYKIELNKENTQTKEEEGKKKENSGVKNVSLKGVCVEWRILDKAMKRKESKKLKRMIEKEKEEKKQTNQQNFDYEILQRKEKRANRLKEVKEVLIETVNLKTKLKKQLDNLNKKVKIEESVVVDCLINAGIDLTSIKESLTEEEQNKAKLANTQKNQNCLEDYN